jgi:hypothetical protein
VAAAVCALAAVGSWQILVVRQDLRLLAVLAGSAVLVAFCANRPRLTMLLTFAWLPFLGLTRRLFDPGGTPATDPFLTVVPLVTSVLLVVAVWSHRDTIGASLNESRITLLVSILLVVLVFAVFNPIQGGPLIGLSGTIFLFFPVLWFYLGRAYLDDETTSRFLWVTVWTGFVCALYGVYQVVFGFLPVEQSWIATREFGSLYVGQFIRPFSTFPSPEEWSRYTMVASASAIGLALAAPRRRWWLFPVSGVCVVALLLSGVRISAFGLLVSIAVAVMMGVRSRMRAFVAVIGLALLLLVFAWLVPQRSESEVRASDVAWSAFFGHATRGLIAPFGEDTLWGRIELWSSLLTDVIPAHPFGMGLGVPTLGAWKFDAQVNVGTESYAGAIFVAAGFIGGFLLLAVFWAVLVRARRLCRHLNMPTVHVTTAVVAGIVFTSVVANSLSLYSVGPLGWALMGWLSARELRG